MKQHHFNRSKLSQIMSYEAYQWLDEWTKQAQSKQRYPMAVKDFFYRNTSHRQYLSKLLESIIIAVLKGMGASPIKQMDSGKFIDNTKKVTDIAGRTRQIGTSRWAKDSRVNVGAADVVCFFNGSKYGAGMYNLECKIGKDRMSDAQKREQIRAEANGEFYFVIKTLDSFLELL